MRIGIVGGLDRNEQRYTQLAAHRGHELEWHNGRISGRKQDALSSLVGRADLVIVQTDINSHGAMWRARELARQLGRPLIVVKRLGTAALAKVLDDLEARLPVRATS